jgi:ribose transport system substrate-binding protein
MRRILAIVVAILLLASVVASAAVNPADLRFTFVNPVVGAPYWNLVDNGINAAAEEFGVNVNIVGPSAVDVNKQIEYFESAAAARVDGIITMALVATSFEPVIDDAIDQGIPVILLDGDASNSKRIAYYGSNNFNGGVTLANRILEDMGDSFSYAVLTYDLAADNANERIDGLHSVLDGYPDVEYLGIEASNDDMVIGTEKTVSMLQSYNNDIDVIIGVGSKDTPCVCLGLEDLGLQGQVNVYGMDAGLDQTRDFIRSGVCTAALAQDPYMMGFLSVKALYDIKVNNQYPAEKVNDTGMIIIDKSNVDTAS